MAGLSHEVGASPAFYVGRLQGHITFDTLADLGYGTAYDEMRILVEGPDAHPRRDPRRCRGASASGWSGPASR